MFGDRVFSTRNFRCFDEIFVRNSQALSKLIASRLAHVCVVMGELPYICFQSNSPVAQQIAIALDESIKFLYRTVPNLNITQNRATIAIMDRRLDLAASLVHDIHYEALLKDLFDVGVDGNVQHGYRDATN